MVVLIADQLHREIFWQECGSPSVIDTSDNALDVGVARALMQYKELFGGQAITNKAQLVEAYPNCCSAYHPNTFPPDEMLKNNNWFVDIAVRSPCTGRDVKATIEVNRCGHVGSGFMKFIEYADLCRPPVEPPIGAPR